MFGRMLPVMTAKQGVPAPGHWVKVKLNGRPVKVTTHYKDGRRLVLIRPIKTTGGN
jgi:hypothetical protein